MYLKKQPDCQFSSSSLIENGRWIGFPVGLGGGVEVGRLLVPLFHAPLKWRYRISVLSEKTIFGLLTE
jgi:hypothetical protein